MTQYIPVFLSSYPVPSLPDHNTPQTDVTSGQADPSGVLREQKSGLSFGVSKQEFPKT